MSGLGSSMQRGVVCVLVAVGITMMPGCSLFVSRNQSVSITASDPAATLIVDGRHIGTGTAAVDLDRTRSHTVTARTPDGRTGASAINKKISGLGVCDIIGGCIFLVPFLGLLGAGFWELDPETVGVDVH